MYFKNKETRTQFFNLKNEIAHNTICSAYLYIGKIEEEVHIAFLGSDGYILASVFNDKPTSLRSIKAEELLQIVIKWTEPYSNIYDCPMVVIKDIDDIKTLYKLLVKDAF